MSVEVVIAKYKESVNWAQNVIHKVTIYDKSDNPISYSIPLPNIGKEAHTFLHHIVSNYDRLADITIFFQGHPFDHVNAGENSIETVVSNINQVTCSQGDYLPAWTIPRADNGDTYHDWVERSKKVPFVNNPVNTQFPFAVGAQYIVSSECIRGRPFNFWKKLYEMSKTSVYGDKDPHKIDPWSMEIIWPIIYSPKQYPVLHPDWN
jgi:hypothetical protein